VPPINQNSGEAACTRAEPDNFGFRIGVTIRNIVANRSAKVAKFQSYRRHLRPATEENHPKYRGADFRLTLKVFCSWRLAENER